MKMERGWTTGLIVLAVVGACAGPVSADVIELKDGRSISGSIHRDGDTMVIQPDAGGQVVTTPDEVVRVTLTNSLTPAQLAAAEWSRTAGLIKKADDLAAIVTLHEKFLEKYPSQEISASVRTSLGEYQKMVEQKAVKFRGRWMASDQVEVTIRTWREQAKPALDEYRAGHMREALESAKAIIQAHDDNPDALAIAGVAAFHVNNLPAAVKCFTSLAAIDNSTPLAENNLAVIASLQRLHAQALLHYAKALQIAPDNRLVLDNIEAALAAYLAANGDKQSAPYRDLSRAFEAPEARMEAQMEKKKLHRFGSTWIPIADYSRIAIADTAVRNAMGRLDASYNANRQNAASLNDQIQQATSDYNTTLSNINTLNANSSGVAPVAGPTSVSAAAGAARASGAPAVNNAAGNAASIAQGQQSLAQISDRKQALEAKRDELDLAAVDMRAQAEKLKAIFAALETPPAGLQRIMEVGEDQVAPDPQPPVDLAKLLASLPQAAEQAAGPAAQTQPAATYDPPIIPTPAQPVQPIANASPGKPSPKGGGGGWHWGCCSGDAGPYGATLILTFNGKVIRIIELPPGRFFIITDPLQYNVGMSGTSGMIVIPHPAPAPGKPSPPATPSPPKPRPKPQ